MNKCLGVPLGLQILLRRFLLLCCFLLVFVAMKTKLCGAWSDSQRVLEESGCKAISWVFERNYVNWAAKNLRGLIISVLGVMFQSQDVGWIEEDV